jgi:hypothetical protein
VKKRGIKLKEIEFFEILKNFCKGKKAENGCCAIERG